MASLYAYPFRSYPSSALSDTFFVYTSHQKVVLEIDFNGGLWVRVSDFITAINLLICPSGLYRDHHHPHKQRTEVYPLSRKAMQCVTYN